MKTATTWDVLLHGRKIDRVIREEASPAKVKDALVDSNCYPVSIEIRRAA